MTICAAEHLKGYVLRVILVMATSVGVALLTREGVWTAPFVVYKLSPSAVRSQCASIHPGMTIRDVDNLIHRGRTPLEESLSSSELFFGDWNQCQVELTPDAKVVSAHMVL